MKQFIHFSLLIILISSSNANVLSNPIVKKGLKKIGVEVLDPSSLSGMGGLMGKKGGLANFAMEQPMAQPGGEGSVLPKELILKAIDETQRLLTLAIDICFYGPYGIPIPTPVINPMVALFNQPTTPVMSAYKAIEAFRKQKDAELYASIAGMATKGFIVARNLNLRHRVDLGTWKDTNPGG